MRCLFALLICCVTAVCNHGQTPAHESLKNFRKGANLGNYLEAPKGQDWGKVYALEDLDAIKSEGFDHIRLPARWNDYTGPAPEFKIDPAFTTKVDFILTNALQRGLAVIVNLHHFDEFTTDPVKEEPKLLALWRQLAEHYKSAPAKLAFEILNEPRDAATTELMNGVYSRVLVEIRKSNPNRVIFVGPGRWNSLDEIPKLKLPENDRNLIVTVHSYEPFLFTHQGATWTGTDTSTTGIIYPGPPQTPLQANEESKKNRGNWFERYNTLPPDQNPSGPKAFRDRLKKVQDWSIANNRPIHVGEFGAYEKADPQSRARFYKDMRTTCEELGFSWAIWDWSAGFKYWDGNKPVQGMREALFGRN